MRPGVLAVAVAVAALTVGAGAPTAQARPEVRQEPSDTYCTPTDPALEELSGMAFVDGVLYAIGDSGTDHRVAVLDDGCAVTRWLDVPVDPYDVEDMASYDGDLWLSDTGDNQSRRDTVALTRMDPVTGQGELHRLIYPDGPHDAEALLIEPGGRPVVVTKEPTGVSGIYVPAGGESVAELASPGPTALTKAGESTFERTDTAGGPPFIIGSILATGGAVSADGTVAAVRTYTDAYLFAVPDGDVVRALSGEPEVIALPAQPQGEALTFDSNGNLLIASEAAGGPVPPIEVLSSATSLVDTPTPATEAPQQPGGRWPLGALAVAGVLAIVSIFYTVGAARRR
ncbi:hypothetical protein [Rhodococcus sp. 14-2470-1a]|uniref:hypothetical protein n=1 Tax=Rhodococcus sp. 14-2470-1a TaxID=2023150 RepID=UPI000B9BF04D|nr:MULTISPECIES: hypothetical protein [unclassified Rhodococcus (in: high G+C Gram-positive bacteria)]OZC89474.1 hypothetical protein CH282_05875 [Rhodococcus sp. 06-418-1B]OZE98859.1 hypothetical protein CH300_24040 [Rhodococcus sp. 15-1154-1]OZF45228.1 hypothetical protein CH292_23795 [Rhodococcus sp. 14-2470-1a]